MKKLRRIVLIFFIVIMISLNAFAVESNQEEIINTLPNVAETVITKAKVLETGEIKEEKFGDLINRVQEVTLEILEGDYKGQRFNAKYTLSYDIDNKIMAYELNEGNKVFTELVVEDGNVKEAIVQDVVRQGYIIWMIMLFFVSVLAIGRKQGLKAIAGLAVTVASVFFIMVPNIYKGYSPIAVSIITSSGIIVVTFIIIAGLNKKSFTAAIGTAGGVILSGIIAFVFGIFAKLSGAQEEAIMLSMNSSHVIFNFREILFAGIVIASLGACMDVGMSIASALDEIKIQNPNIDWKELFKSGMNIGGDVIGTMTNTLILAYVGGALSLILLFMSTNMSLTEIINKETISSDIISAIAGSMGVIYTIPATAIVYCLLNKGKTAYKKRPEDELEGKRSLKL